MQKAFNYRSEPVGTVFDPKGNDYTLKNPSPATPVWLVPVGKEGPVSSGGGLRQATNYSFTIHGVLCLEHRFRPSRGKVPIVASELAITCGTLRTFEFTPAHAGDHAYRRGVLKWAVHE